jgi:hypothetical protein
MSFEEHLKTCPYCRRRYIQSQSKGASGADYQREREDLRRLKLGMLGKIIRGEAGLSKV